MAEHDGDTGCGCRTIECEGKYKTRTTIQSNYPCAENVFHLEIDVKEAHLEILDALMTAMGIVYALLRKYIKEYLKDGNMTALQMKLDHMTAHIRQLEND